ncbi:TIGR00297 family protein [Phormidium sp. CCY1219]|uniref:TIGR00297 family protein n=1 Tax=Phormidium sp. CCY1219 TaxID=2886104 RepID=UPI002D1E59C2|nr:TIGR00297 family protein [Phormidium sp. CCY1219]MEB3826114.1 TIGR00297 family protein [Phormidium sp. CCY1219]
MLDSEVLFHYSGFWNPWLVAVGLNTILLAIVYVLPKKLLTLGGVIHAWILGVLIWGSLGWRGYLVVGFYFIVGSAVTRIGIAQKEAEGIAQKRSGARGPENVWGSALTAALCALGVLAVQVLSPSVAQAQGVIPLLLLGYVASFSTKLSDTTASEVGKVYGKRTFLITTLQSVPKGTEGAVSLEGTIAGVVASAAIAVVGYVVGSIDLTGLVLCVIAAFVATTMESLIGATLQDKVSWMTNEVVNIINTTIGAIAAIGLAIAVNFAQGGFA